MQSLRDQHDQTLVDPRQMEIRQLRASTHTWDLSAETGQSGGLQYQVGLTNIDSQQGVALIS